MPDLKVRVGGAWQSVTTAGPPGTPGGAPHAITHTPGNTDTIPNVAWTNVANTFTQLQTAAGLRSTGLAAGSAGPGLELTMSGGATYIQGYDRTLADYIPLNLYGKQVEFFTGAGGAGGIRGRMHQSGGFSWGSTTDPGASNLSVAGHLLFEGAANHRIGVNSNDGADTGNIQLCGGPIADRERCSLIQVHGNESPAPGYIDFLAGNTASGGHFRFFLGEAYRGQMYRSGGFAWGGTLADPGANTFAPEVVAFKRYHEVVIFPGSGGGTVTLDLSLGTVFVPIIDNSCTIVFNNVPAPSGSRATSIWVLLYKNLPGAQTVTWPANVRWPNATPPVFSTVGSGLFDVVTLITYNNGTFWLAFNGGQNL